MDYYFMISSVIVFVENRLQGEIDYAELEKATGFSLAHIRDVFAKKTGKSLSKYILSRRIANAAFEIVHSEQSILEIATKYGIPNPDTFTRAFKRITALTPQEFRKQRCAVGRIKLCGGVFGVGIIKQNNQEDKNK